MTVASLDIEGLRGFSDMQTLRLAQPNGKHGSGITILVGPNSGGKSTIVESFQALTSRNVSFSEGRRNKTAGDRVSVRIESLNGEIQELRTADAGGSTTIRDPQSGQVCYVLPSRRYFNPYFGQGRAKTRESYLLNRSLPSNRSAAINDFAHQRLFAALEKLGKFNSVLQKVMNPVPDWTIDQSDEGNYYVKMRSADQFHNTDGVGEGIVSLLFLVDALYDSSPGELIVIDEPELSLHPQFQRRLALLFAEYATNLQILYATHSPYFIDFECILNGAEVARVHKIGGRCLISQLSRESVSSLKGLLRNTHNPHVFGTDAREAFFQEDGIIVVEGQEDVVYLPKVIDQLVDREALERDSALHLRERFYGWGAGGASNIEKILQILHDLGFGRVASIYDKNEIGLIPRLEEAFGDFFFGSIPADDVPTKEGSGSIGLLDEDYRLRPEYEDATAKLFGKVSEYLQSSQADTSERNTS